MLKQRVITALVLIPLVILGVFYLPLLWFAWISAAVFLLTGWEWAALSGLKNTYHRLLFLLFSLIFFWLLGVVPQLYPLLAGLLTWICLPFFLKRTDLWARCWEINIYLRLALGIWLLGLAWYAINFILGQGWGSLLLLTLFLWVWGADIGAYFMGRAYGKHKLAPSISPGKTWEGVLGGAITTILLAIIMGLFFPFGVHYYFGLLLLSIVIVLISVLGDLFESMIKRQSKIKDSGTLLPGHGGLLDRLDSLISAAPVFAVGVVLLDFLK
ncbi:MAG: hypothetical protein K0Q74_1080 [Gammaproteobacteria bacterium]|jgi:phosphatidate cytidylyltransferase|nr:hypothetical protein [Gammaproteobacteria bacterium]